MNEKTTSTRGRAAVSGRSKPAGRRGIAARSEAIIASKKPTARRGRKTAAETPDLAVASELDLKQGTETDLAGVADVTAGTAAADEPAVSSTTGSANVDKAASDKAAASVGDHSASGSAALLSEAAEAVVPPADVAIEAAPAATEAAVEAVEPASRARPARKPRKAIALTADPAAQAETPAARPRRQKTPKAAATSAAGEHAEPARKPRAAKAPKPLRKPKVPTTVVAESADSTPQRVVPAVPLQTPATTRPPLRDFRIAAGLPGEAALRLSNELRAEMARFSDDAIAAGSDGLLNVATAKTLPELIERQARSAKQAANLWILHSSRIGSICIAVFDDIRGRR
jgi:hypothetical protein